MKRRHAALAGALIALLPLAASAEVAFVNRDFSVANFGSIGLTPFDPALGTLDSVNVSIDGSLVVQGFSGPNLVPVGGGALVPAPYSFQVLATQDFFGVPGGRYFTFGSDAQYFLSGVASGAGESFQMVMGFSYDFTFNATTDNVLGGFTIPSLAPQGVSAFNPPTTVIGTRAGFVEPEFSIVEQVDLVMSGTALDARVNVFGLQAQGAILMQYNYTPHAAPIPEPQTYALLFAGLAVLGFSRRRGRR